MSRKVLKSLPSDTQTENVDVLQGMCIVTVEGWTTHRGVADRSGQQFSSNLLEAAITICGSILRGTDIHLYFTLQMAYLSGRQYFISARSQFLPGYYSFFPWSWSTEHSQGCCRYLKIFVVAKPIIHMLRNSKNVNVHYTTLLVIGDIFMQLTCFTCRTAHFCGNKMDQFFMFFYRWLLADISLS